MAPELRGTVIQISPDSRQIIHNLKAELCISPFTGEELLPPKIYLRFFGDLEVVEEGAVSPFP